MVPTVAVDLARRRVEGDGDLFAGRVAGLLDGFDQHADGVFVGRQVGREPTLVADGRRQPPLVQQALEHVVGLRPPLQRLGVGRGAHRHEHELLQVDVVVGVHAAVDDVHHRDRQHVGVGPADVPVQRQLQLVGGSLGRRQGRAQDGVGTQAAFVVGAIE